MSNRRPHWLPRHANSFPFTLVLVSMTMVVITQVSRLVGELHGWEDALLALTVLLWVSCAAVLLAPRRQPDQRARS